MEWRRCVKFVTSLCQLTNSLDAFHISNQIVRQVDDVLEMWNSLKQHATNIHFTNKANVICDNHLTVQMGCHAFRTSCLGGCISFQTAQLKHTRWGSEWERWRDLERNGFFVIPSCRYHSICAKDYKYQWWWWWWRLHRRCLHYRRQSHTNSLDDDSWCFDVYRNGIGNNDDNSNDDTNDAVVTMVSKFKAKYFTNSNATQFHDGWWENEENAYDRFKANIIYEYICVHYFHTLF